MSAIPNQTEVLARTAPAESIRAMSTVCGHRPKCSVSAESWSHITSPPSSENLVPPHCMSRHAVAGAKAHATAHLDSSALSAHAWISPLCAIGCLVAVEPELVPVIVHST
eukprot:209332-Rhodomonas_salina.4